MEKQKLQLSEQEKAKERIEKSPLRQFFNEPEKVFVKFLNPFEFKYSEVSE